MINLSVDNDINTPMHAIGDTEYDIQFTHKDSVVTVKRKLLSIDRLHTQTLKIRLIHIGQ